MCGLTIFGSDTFTTYGNLSVLEYRCKFLGILTNNFSTLHLDSIYFTLVLY